MKAYYNEFDPFAAAWLRELITEGLIADGDVDERSIVDVTPDDLTGYGQCHFFAGIGGWSLALRYAGVPDSVPVWTGSCPCQPFSVAGAGKGTADDRHLWPVFSRLIADCRPVTVFGEQVEGAVKHGWLDGVYRDLEREGYTCGAVVLGAHSVGAPHIRQRLYWVADYKHEGLQGRVYRRQDTQREDFNGYAGCGSTTDWLADTEHSKRREIAEGRNDDNGHCGRRDETASGLAACCADAGRLANTEMSERRRYDGADDGRRRIAEAGGSGIEPGGMGISHRAGSQSRCLPAASTGYGNPADAAGGRTDTADSDVSLRMRSENDMAGRGMGTARMSGVLPYREWRGDIWRDAIAIPCGDGKTRRIPAEPALFPLADGIPNRVGCLRGAGNAIVPEVAAEFIRAFYEVTA